MSVGWLRRNVWGNVYGMGTVLGALTSRGWKTSSDIRELTTSHWMKQLTWLRTVLCGGWSLRMALCTPRGACQKWRRLSWIMSWGYSLVGISEENVGGGMSAFPCRIKCPRLAVMICATMVQTDTHGQLLTSYATSSVSWAETNTSHKAKIMAMLCSSMVDTFIHDALQTKVTEAPHPRQTNVSSVQ